MDVSLAPIPTVLSIEDVCRLMRISRAMFFQLRERGWFGAEGPALIEIEPSFDRRVRYHGRPFAEWLTKDAQLRLTRARLREAR